LFIDGEMPGEWLQTMIRDATRRLGSTPDNLCFLNRDDYPGLAPLNTKEGYAFLRGYIEEHGPYDFIAFDNIMSLTAGNPKDPEAWQAMLELIAYLSRIRTGQLWINHTGHDTTRGYGDKTRDWRMTSVIHMDAVGDQDSGVSFELKFVKKRESTPRNRADFQTVQIALVNDRWTCSAVTPGRIVPLKNSPGAAMLAVLIELAASDQGIDTDGGEAHKIVETLLWRDACVDRGLCPGKAGKSAETYFYKIRSELVRTENVSCKRDYSWPL
jgi:hypothetical protein